MSYNRGKKWNKKNSVSSNGTKKEFNHPLLKNLFNKGIQIQLGGVYHPISQEKGVINTSLIKGKIDDVKKEILISYEVLQNSTDWVLKELREMNQYFLNLLDNSDKQISEFVLNELKDYTIITQRQFEDMIFQGVVEPKNKVGNRWFN